MEPLDSAYTQQHRGGENRHHSIRPRSEKMIQSLHIEKSAPGQYLARVMNEHSEALCFTSSCIAGAIRDAARMIPKARAFHIWYEHVSIGTTPVLHMQNDPETLASKLKLLHGQFWG
ncbi:hypothetical protein [Comamonas sp. 4034]|uniref:hypothetical protein n=1 Tax=Comamonas sp. 4034 TaxID=3156455 RepID=UPI003D20971D